MVIFDTDHVSLLQWKVGTEGRRLAQRLAVIPADEIVTTTVAHALIRG